MTVCDVLRKASPEQLIKIEDEMRGNVLGTAMSLNEMLSQKVKTENVGMLRAEKGVIVVEVAEE